MEEFDENSSHSTLFEDLGNGLILRASTAADQEKLAEFNGKIHGEDEQDTEAVAVWTRDLLAGKHPTFGMSDFTIVEERATGKIVSSMNLISQTWSYAGIPFKVGRPELVGTDPEYRNRGLIRRQFEEIHRWSKQRGEMVQAITGIPYYYRLFGYEMAMNLGGGRTGYPVNAPNLAENEAETYTLRPAATIDIPFVQQVYEQNANRSLVSVQWNALLWHHELNEKSAMNVDRLAISIVQTGAGEPVGFIACPYGLWGTSYALTYFELKPGQSWYKIAPAVMRYLIQTGQSLAQAAGKQLESVQFELGETHSAYEILKQYLPVVRKPYAWYLRVADLPAFLGLIRPVLEDRLEESLSPGFDGELKLSFYSDGLRLVFARGRLENIEPWKPEQWHGADLLFPGLAFFQLLFGYRTMEELRYALPDCISRKPNLDPVIDALFPKHNSHLLPIA